MDSRTRVLFWMYLLMFACFLSCVAAYAVTAGSTTGGYIMYVLSLINCVLYGRTLYLLRRLGYDAEQALMWQAFTEIGTITFQLAAYFETDSLVFLLVGLVGILTFFGPGGRGKRDATTALIGEKSRALLARINNGVAPDPSEG